ncbi:uncharacterized protein LOC100835120 [Brachypodium distachyon]|uniref:Uncharacterized protein n=1 Tax=Brachypodium distachyon TaxID=15368 RepID=I1HZA0_BRADI|nr:uncharacterized protein LOC100835120 [Brachypodium distachyon]KQJ94264.1 hypothetical protein BRADI_3g09530v3 [Brachypodium distachyon]|eukprot:XP_003572091.1 uncharacterized protein LOC100835120 [Brachypodium distachyon]
MGNCIQGSHGDGDGGVPGGDHQGLVQMQASKRSGEVEDHQEEASASVLKVKMVLTKGELEWLMAQLKAGDRRLEDVLRDMARKRDHHARSGNGAWRPSLESILECPSAETAPAAPGAD